MPAKKKPQVMPETAAIAALKMQLAEYDDKLRKRDNEVEHMVQSAEQMMRIADEAISIVSKLQRVKTLEQLQEANAMLFNAERWFRTEATRLKGMVI